MMSEYILNMLTDNQERELFAIRSEGWDRDMSTILIKYGCDDSIDLHIQTGDHYSESLERATKILKDEGMELDGEEMTESSGVYHGVRGV